MEMVKKTLGQTEDEKTPKDKRTHLENIDEEAISVDFIKRQFSNFSLGQQKEVPASVRVEGGSSPSKTSQTFYPESNFMQLNSGNDEQDIMPPTLGSMSSHHVDSNRGSSHANSNEFTVPVDLSLTVAQIAKQFGIQ